MPTAMTFEDRIKLEFGNLYFQAVQPQVRAEEAERKLQELAAKPAQDGKPA